MLSIAFAYASPSSESSVLKADVVAEVEEEVKSAMSVAWMREDTTARASAKGVKDSSGYPLLHREASDAMLNRPS
jgi:hypothetical protein